MPAHRPKIRDPNIEVASFRFRQARGLSPWEAEPSLLDETFTEAEREAVIRLYLLLEGFRVGGRASTLAALIGPGRIRPPYAA